EAETRAATKDAAASGATLGWSYDITVLHSDGGSGYLYVQATPYGVFASEEECQQARAEKIALMEAERGRDGKIPSWAVTHPIRQWRAITPPTILTDQHSSSSYQYGHGSGGGVNSNSNGDLNGRWSSNSGAGWGSASNASSSSSSSTTQRIVRGASQAYNP